jgi:hypothetical protein
MDAANRNTDQLNARKEMILSYSGHSVFSVEPNPANTEQMFHGILFVINHLPL